VRRDGDLAGYRWGVERKRALLAKERETTPADAAAD
jgi:O6-methylguanine-DNA--protein-cysteine methyltransferase